MSLQYIRINLKYKLNKLEKGKWKNPKRYIDFFGNEIDSLKQKDDDPDSRKIYKGDIVIFMHPSKKNHPNNGLRARVIEVHKPLKLKDKIKAYEEKPDKKIYDYPLKEKRYDLIFDLDEDDKEERRLNLEQQNQRAVIKKSMEFVEREKIKSIPEKKLLISYRRDELNNLKGDVNKKQESIIEEKVGNLFDIIFKKDTIFKPKYVDKPKKNFESMEEWRKENSLLPYKEEEELVQKGDIITTNSSNDIKKKLTYEKPTKKYKITSYNIEKIDFSNVLKSTPKDGNILLLNSELEKFGEKMRNNRDKHYLFGRVKKWITTKYEDDKFNNPSVLLAIFYKPGFFKNKLNKSKKSRGAEYKLIESWKKELKTYIIALVHKKTGTDKTKVVEKTLLKRENIEKFKELFSFINDKFILRPIMEQLYLIEKIVVEKDDNYDGLKKIFDLYGENTLDKNINDFLDDKDLESQTTGSFVEASTPNMDVFATIYLQSDDELSAKLGFGSSCDKSLGGLKKIFGLMFTRKKGKKGKKKKKGGAKKRTRYLFKKKRKKKRKNRTRKKRKKNTRKN